MNQIAILEIEGRTYPLLDFHYQFQYDTDPKGQRGSGMYGGELWVTIESSSDTYFLECLLWGMKE